MSSVNLYIFRPDQEQLWEMQLYATIDPEAGIQPAARRLIKVLLSDVWFVHLTHI